MKLFDGLEQIVKTDVPLSQYTWYGIGGPAKYFVEPQTFEQLVTVAKRCRENQVPTYVLGHGSNLLVDDAGVNGVVIHLSGGEFNKVTFEGTTIKASAGADMSKIVLRCVREGLTGLECLTGIPGSVGGCVRMNAGGSFGDLGNVIESVHVCGDEGEIFTRHRDDLVFTYRSTNITSKYVLGVEMKLAEDDPQRILKQVKQIWIYKKNTQPLGKRNAGCVFKNPRGLSAGALIDRAGLKGKKVGGAYVSDKHANFILVDAGAKASDVMKLVNIIRENVYKKSEVYLELEIEVW
jgi:UDP-N-acetylmuramate dehydrogenase